MVPPAVYAIKRMVVCMKAANSLGIYCDPIGNNLFYAIALGASAPRDLRGVGGLQDICPAVRGGVSVGQDGFSVSILAQDTTVCDS